MNAPRSKAIAVLGYHKIGTPPPGSLATWFYVPEETFATQLACLTSADWKVIDLATFLEGLETPSTLPDRSVLLTFDDGCHSLTAAALDQLQRFGFPAVVFVPTDFIGKTNSFDVGVEPEERICDWGDLQRLEEAGISIQSHSASHQSFSTIDATALDQELARSKAALEQGLVRPVQAFAYPFGDNGTDPPATEALLERAGYKCAFLYGGGTIMAEPVHRYRIPRIAMGPDTDLEVILEE